MAWHFWQENCPWKGASSALLLAVLEAFLPHFLPPSLPLEQTQVLCPSPCCRSGCRHQKWKCNSGLNLTEIWDFIENMFSSIITNTLLHKWHHLYVTVVPSPLVLHLVTAEEGRMSWDTTSPHNKWGFLGSYMCCCLIILPWDGFADKKRRFLASRNLSRPDISAARQLGHIKLRGACSELLYF